MKFSMITLILLCGMLVFSGCKKDDPEPPAMETPINQQNNNGIIVLPSQPSQSAIGNLSSGSPLSTLEWAWDSNMACFVESAEVRFTGNHVFYQVELPTNSVATIHLIPDSPTAQIALYGYTKASGNMDLPPAIYGCVACEADPSNSSGSMTGERSIEFVAINNPYSIIIGVAGGDQLAEGGFTLEVEIES